MVPVIEESLRQGPRPSVSVITATFQAEATLRACIESVQNQDYSNVEHLILDGASTDQTVRIASEYLSAGVICSSEPDSGIYDAWNKGLARATGDWICFLGADDTLLPGAISAYMRLASQNPEALYLSSKVRWVRPSGKFRVIGEPWSWPRFQRYMCTAHPGSMHHRKLFTQYGCYDDTLRIVGDYEFLLRPGSSLRTAFLPQVTVEMQGGGTSDSIRALDEAKQVKIETAKRHPWLASWERLVARQIFRLRRTFIN